MARLVDAALVMPVDASADGWRIDRLLHTTAAMTGVLAALLCGLLVFAALRGRQRAGRARPGGSRGDTWRAILLPVGVTTVIFLVVDGNLWLTSMRDLYGAYLATDSAEREPGAVRIEINAQQWMWNVRHAGLDGRFATDDDVVTSGEMRVPVGRAVVVQLASSDVVHSFFLPHFRVKLDAVPGRIATTWFRPVAPGSYEIACTQHCGVHHHLMRGVVTVMEPGDFDRWVADGSRDALRIAAEDARARAEEPTRARPAGVDPAADPAEARRWGWPWRPAGRDAGRDDR